MYYIFLNPMDFEFSKMYLNKSIKVYAYNELN